jgi:hypothetical protein
MPSKEQDVLACARFLGIKPEQISRVEVTTDGGGHFTGIDVLIHIPTGRQLGEWVKDHLPKEKVK